MCVYVCRFCVCVCVCLSICACLVFENVYQRYMYSNTHFPVEKTYLCIYSIYIVSVSFAYNMQTATWWSDSTEVHLKDGAGGGGVKENVCMGGIEPDSSTYIPLRWLVRRRLEKEKRNTEVRFLWHFSTMLDLGFHDTRARMKLICSHCLLMFVCSN